MVILPTFLNRRHNYTFMFWVRNLDKIRRNLTVTNKYKLLLVTKISTATADFLLVIRTVKNAKLIKTLTLITIDIYNEKNKVLLCGSINVWLKNFIFINWWYFNNVYRLSVSVHKPQRTWMNSPVANVMLLSVQSR